jgi:hypothetical protein
MAARPGFGRHLSLNTPPSLIATILRLFMGGETVTKAPGGPELQSNDQYSQPKLEFQDEVICQRTLCFAFD